MTETKGQKPRTRISTRKPPKTRARTAQAVAGVTSPALKVEDKDRPKGVYAKLAYIQAHVEAVEETGSVDYQPKGQGRVQYKHMQEHGLLAVLRPFFRELRCGYYVSMPESTKQGNHTKIAGTLTFFDAESHPEDGEYLVGHFTNEAVDTADKGTNKAMTAWTKYALQKFFAVPTQGIDDTETSEPPVAATMPIQAPPEGAAQALRQDLQNAVSAGTLTQNRIKALLQGTYGADNVDQLSGPAINAVRAALIEA